MVIQTGNLNKLSNNLGRLNQLQAQVFYLCKIFNYGETLTMQEIVVSFIQNVCLYSRQWRVSIIC